MKKRSFYPLLLLLLTVFFLFPAPYAAAGEQKVFDTANLLDPEQRSELEALCGEISGKVNADIVIVTSDDSSVYDIEEAMKELHAELSFGDTVMLGVDMYNREVCISAFGEKTNVWMDQERETLIRKKITRKLTDGQYEKAFQTFLSLTEKYSKVKPGINPNNPFLKTWFQLVLALVAGAVTAGIMAINRKPKMTAGSGTYLDHNNARILARHDRYIRTTVTKRPVPKSDSGGSGGSSGGSGGSSYSSSKGSF